MILGIRTDQPDATVILATSRHPELVSGSTSSDSRLRGNDVEGGGSDVETVDRAEWLASRQLSNTLLKKIEELLGKHDKNWADLTAIVVYEGPGSFTGLRIGLTVANTIAFEQDIPVVGSTGDDWFEAGLKKIQGSKFQKIVMPEYGGEANISKPKK